MSFLDSYKISNEEFASKFSIWLFEQSIINFKKINGFEIIREFVKQDLGHDLLSEITDYRYFIDERRELIKVIEIWVSTFDLAFDDYKIFFENYCKDLLLRDERNLKIAFSTILQSFHNEIIIPNFIINKSDIRKYDLKNIFINLIAERKYNEINNVQVLKIIRKEANTLREQEIKDKLFEEKIVLKQEIKAIRQRIRNENLAKKIASNEESKIIKLKRREKVIEEKELNKTKLVAIKNAEKLFRLEEKQFCQKCNVSLLSTSISNTKKYGKFCENCFKQNKSETKKRFHQNFPEKVKAARNKYKSNRIQRDIPFKILQRLRARILLVLHGKKKMVSSLNLLGCSPEFLKTHLELRFRDGMTWDNYGIKGWHIDHIKPCASFDLTKIDDQKECFHYSNLQPLWWHENIEKSDKII